MNAAMGKFKRPYRGSSRWPRRLLIAWTLVALVSTVGYWALHRWLNDERIARLVTNLSSAQIAGELRYGSIHWSPRAIVDLAMGTAHPIEVKDFAIVDPTGRVVVSVPLLRAKVELFPLIVRQNIQIHDLRLNGGRCVVAPMSGDRIGLIEAFSSPSPGGGAPVVSAQDFRVSGVEFLLDYPGLKLSLKQIAAEGSSYYGGGDPAVDGMKLKASLTAAQGLLSVGTYVVPLGDLRTKWVEINAASPQELQVNLSVSAAGTPVSVQGRLKELFRAVPKFALAVRADKLRPLARRLLDTEVASAKAQTRFSIRGPVVKPRLQGSISGLKFATDKVNVQEISTDFRLGTKRLRLENVQGKAFSGRLRGKGNIEFTDGDWQGQLRVDGVDLKPLHSLLDGDLSGSLRLSGQTTPPYRQLAVMSLTLQRRKRGWLPKELALRGTAHLSPQVIDLADFSLEGEGNQLTVSRGSVNLKQKRVNLFVNLDASHLGSWLKRRGRPVVARSARAELNIKGVFPHLHASGNATVNHLGYGKMRLPRADAVIDFDGGRINIRNLRSSAYGGLLNGAGTVDLFDGSVLRPLAKPVLSANLKATLLDLQKLGLGDYMTGKASGTFGISGAIDQLRGVADLRLAQLNVMDDPYSGGDLRFGVLKDRVTIYESNLVREKGGRVQFYGDLYYDGRLGMTAETQAFPLSGVPGVSKIPLGLAGLIDGKVALSGKLSDPRLEGEIRLSKAKLRTMILGQGRIQLTPKADRIEVAGHFFEKLANLTGHIFVRPQPSLHLDLDIRRFPLEKAIHELSSVGDIKGQADGRITLDADTSRGLYYASVRLNQLSLRLRYRPPGSRNDRTARLTNRGPIVALWQDGVFDIKKSEFESAIPGRGDNSASFSMGGQLTGAKPDLWLNGRVSLAVLEFFLTRRVNRIRGEARADIKLLGTWKKPDLKGEFSLHGTSVKLPNFDQTIEIPEARVRLVPGALTLDLLQLRVGDHSINAKGELLLDDRLRPDFVELNVDGEINMKLINLFFPSRVSQASGSAKIIKLKVEGLVNDPSIAGRIEVQRIDVVPRGVGRLLALTSGTIDFDGYQYSIVKPLVGQYDEGQLTITGDARFNRMEPIDVNVRIVGAAIPFRKPKIYSAEANFDLQLVGDNPDFTLKGEVDLVDTRYVREFDFVKELAIKPRVYEQDDPLWKESAFLRDLKLNLALRSSGEMLVKNQYGKMGLSGKLKIEGTLSKPRLDGQVRATEGAFKFPGLWGEYSLNRGEIIFDKDYPTDESTLDVLAESQHTDPSGTDYRIQVQLKGNLKNFQMKLSSIPKLDQGQILTLIATGRTTDQLRSQLRGSQDGAANIADEQIKSLTGRIISDILSEKIKDATGLDVLQLKMGSRSFEAKACKKFSRWAELCGSTDAGLQGEVSAKAEALFLIHDYLRLTGEVERLDTRLDTDTDDPTRARGLLKFRYRLR